jgi:hypothetical protein
MAVCEDLSIMENPTGSISIEQEPVAEQEEVAVPLIGGDMAENDIKANFNALLYLMTEQMAVQLKMMDLMIRKELVTPEEMNDEVLYVTGDQEGLTEIYNEMFTRFVGYFAALKKLHEDGRIFEAEAQTPVSEEN